MAGGLTVTLRGAGFHGFTTLGVPAATGHGGGGASASPAGGTAGPVRCRFGGAAGVETEATPLNDSALLCAVPPWAAPPAEVLEGLQ